MTVTVITLDRRSARVTWLRSVPDPDSVDCALLGQRIAIGMGVLVLTALPGCYGSTEPATDVGPESATLQGRGTANNGAAQVFFEYWLTDADRIRKRIGDRIPAGASGPYRKRVTQLAAGSSYSFKLCGNDEPAGETVCAQTRTFTTRPPVEDALMGYFYAGCCSRFDIDAHSGPNGEDPRGELRYHVASSSSQFSDTFTGSISCLAANGDRAAAGAVGSWRNRGPATILFTAVDRGAEEDTINIVDTAGSAPPDCANASFANQGQIIIPDHELIVNDAPGGGASAG